MLDHLKNYRGQAGGARVIWVAAVSLFFLQGACTSKVSVSASESNGAGESTSGETVNLVNDERSIFGKWEACADNSSNSPNSSILTRFEISQGLFKYKEFRFNNTTCSGTPVPLASEYGYRVIGSGDSGSYWTEFNLEMTEAPVGAPEGFFTHFLEPFEFGKDDAPIATYVNENGNSLYFAMGEPTPIPTPSNWVDFHTGYDLSSFAADPTGVGSVLEWTVEETHTLDGVLGTLAAPFVPITGSVSLEGVWGYCRNEGDYSVDSVIQINGNGTFTQRTQYYNRTNCVGDFTARFLQSGSFVVPSLGQASGFFPAVTNSGQANQQNQTLYIVPDGSKICFSSYGEGFDSPATTPANWNDWLSQAQSGMGAEVAAFFADPTTEDCLDRLQ